MNATTVQNVVTYNTIIDFDNPDLKLFPGMTAYISIPVANAQNVMRVPNGALRYKPDMTADEVRALYKQYGLASGDQQGQQPAAGGTGERRRGGQSGSGDGTAAAGAAPQKTPRMDVSVIWKLHPDKTLEPVRIRTGITDHTTTEVAQVLKGNLNPGDELVTGATTASASGSRPPGLGGGRR
jgi:HlyD family secretion protein